MSNAIKINAAQQIRWALGIDFPLFTSRGEPRNLSHTKKGPGRRPELSAAEKLLRAGKRSSARKRLYVAVLRNRDGDRHWNKSFVSTDWAVMRRGAWSLYLHQGVLKMRGFSTGPRRVWFGAANA